jgi:uncharacterized protein DUF1631
MSAVLTSNRFDIDAILAGAEEPLLEILRQLPSVEGDQALVLAELFWSAWRDGSALHGDLLNSCEPLRAALIALDPTSWVPVPEHSIWRVLGILQQSCVGYQPELGRAGEKILTELGGALAELEHGDWPAAAAALERWWQQDQQRLSRLEQRLIDVERGQLRSRRAQQVAARLLNQKMAGKQFARSIAVYLQREWFQELQWALLQFGADSPQWQRRALLTERLIDSLQPAHGDDEAQQRLYALIPDVSAELAAVLDERAHDRATLEQQLALIEAEHLVLLRGQTPVAADFQLIANHDPWLSTATTISASLLQKVAVLTPGSWFVYRDTTELRVKLALKLDDSTQLLFVNRLGVKALQKSFEEFAYLLSVGAVVPLPVDAAHRALRGVLEQLTQLGVEQQHERAEARRQTDNEARRRIEAKAKAIAEAKVLAAAQAQAAAEVAQRQRDEEAARRNELLQQQLGEQEQRQRAARQEATLLSIGSWIELRDDAGATQRLKVAVKLPSSGKLILVDRDGVRRAEFERDAFAARLLDGSAQILKQGLKFEDTLAKVVDSMRRDRAPRE